MFWVVLALGLLWLSNIFTLKMTDAPKELTYSKFYQILKDNPTTHQIKSVSKTDSVLQGELSDGSKFSVFILEEDKDLINLLKENVPDFVVKPLRTFWTNLLFTLGPILLFIGFWWFMANRGEQMGNRIMGLGKVQAKPVIDGQREKITFNDVAGVDEAREELQEVIEFLKDPEEV